MLVAALALAAAFDITTAANTSDHARTGRLSELRVVCDRLTTIQQGCDVFGTSPEGRPMHAYTLSSIPAPKRAANAAFRTRPTVLVIGGIHAGEIDGKDASIAVLKRLVDGDLTGVLEHVTVVFVPVYNVDGHERFGKNNRPNQRGPEEMGWRTTSQNLNLNRDWAKADAPETRAMLALIERVDPVVIMDLHVTDGAKFQHDIAVMVEPWHDDGSDTPLIEPALTLQRGLIADLTATGHLPLPFYPSFERDDDPASGFAVGVVPARLTHGYAARRGRVGVLVETHSWHPYKARVQATVDVVAGFLRRAQTDAASWRRAADESDRLRASLVGKPVALAFDNDPASTTTIDFLGYAYAIAPSDVSGAPWIRYDETTPQTWRVPLVRDVTATRTVTAPLRYVVLPGFAPAVAAVLRAHGVRFTVVEKAYEEPAQRFVAADVTFSTTPYEGRQTAKFKGAWQPRAMAPVPVGSLSVPVAQPRGRLVVELLEPSARESLAAWGFMNARFEQKEYMEAYVAEDVARAQLKDPAVRAAFDEKLKDPAFAKDPAARLDFFYRRHASYDVEHNVLPVLRIE